jgi:importin-5
MLDTLPALASSLSGTPAPTPSSPTSNYHHLSTFFSTLTPLCTTHPTLFAPHLPALLTFLPGLILPPVDCGPTPTVGRPFPRSGGSRQGAFVFPPPSPNPSSPPSSPPSASPASSASANSHDDRDTNEEDDQKQTLRLSALEFMLSLSEAKQSMVKKVPGWVEIMVRACLEAMGEFEEDEGAGTSLEAWLAEDVSTSSLCFDFVNPHRPCVRLAF